MYEEIAYNVSDIMHDPCMTAKKWQPGKITSEFVQYLTHSKQISQVFTDGCVSLTAVFHAFKLEIKIASLMLF